MSEGSVRERLPSWLDQARVIEFPEINSAAVIETGIPEVRAMVVTAQGLEILQPQLRTADGFIDFLGQSARFARAFEGKGDLRRISDSLLMKLDRGYDSIETVLTHQLLDLKLPRETEEYIYNPAKHHLGVEFFYNGGVLSLTFMDKVNVVPITNSDHNAMLYKGWNRLKQEAVRAGVGISGTLQDVLHQGFEERSGLLVPKIAVVDQAIERVHTRLKYQEHPAKMQ